MSDPRDPNEDGATTPASAPEHPQPAETSEAPDASAAPDTSAGPDSSVAAPPASAPPLPPYAAALPATYPGATYPGAAQPPAGTPFVQPYPGAPPAAAYGAGMVPPIGPGAVPPPGSRPKTLAVIGFVMALIGFAMALVPFVTWFSGVLLLAGFVIGLIALIKKTQGAKGLSIAALIISVVGWIVSVVVSIASIGLLAESTNDAIPGGSGTTVSEPPEDLDEPSEAESTAQDLQVVESAFGRTSYDPNTWWYVVILENPNADYVFDFATIDIEALAADGTILDTSSDFPTLLSGPTAIAGIFTDVGQGEIAALDVRGPDAVEAIASPLDETGAFIVDGVTAASDDYSTNVTGTVSGTFVSDQEFVRVVVVARAPDGRIIGAEYAYIDRLPRDGTAVQFQATFFDVLPEDTTFEAFASL